MQDRIRDRKRDSLIPITGIIRGQIAYFIVALDGSGTFTDLQSAINALPAAGGLIYVKNGTYTIKSTIVINKQNVQIIGSGPNTILIAKNALNSNVIWIQKGHVLISDVVIDGNCTNQTAGDGAKLQCPNTYPNGENIDYVSFVRCGFQNIKDNAIEFLDSSDNEYCSNYPLVQTCVISTSNVAIRLSGNAPGFRMFDSNINTITTHAIKCDGAGLQNAIISGNTISSGNSYPQIYFPTAGISSENVNIAQNIFTGGTGSIALVTASYLHQNWFITNNFFYLTAQFAADNTVNIIDAQGMYDSVIVGNATVDLISKRSKNFFNESNSTVYNNIIVANRMNASVTGITLGAGSTSINANNLRTG